MKREKTLGEGENALWFYAYLAEHVSNFWRQEGNAKLAGDQGKVQWKISRAFLYH